MTNIDPKFGIIECVRCQEHYLADEVHDCPKNSFVGSKSPQAGEFLDVDFLKERKRQDLNDKMWDYRFFHIAESISLWSKDPSTKIGAIAVGHQRQIIAQGYNGFPRGIADDAHRLHTRKIKYQLILHAEMALISNASKSFVSLENSTIYVAGIPPCQNCTLMLIQIGVKRVVVHYNDIQKNIERIGEDTRNNWIEKWDMSKELFSEAKVEVKILT